MHKYQIRALRDEKGGLLLLLGKQSFDDPVGFWEEIEARIKLEPDPIALEAKQHRETVEEFLSRGGEITQLKPKRQRVRSKKLASLSPDKKKTLREAFSALGLELKE